MMERVSTAPAGADSAVIIATNMLALNRSEFGAAKWFDATPRDVETLCRWIAEHAECPRPYGEPVGFDEPPRLGWFRRMFRRFRR